MISYQSLGISFQPKEKRALSAWIKAVVKKHGRVTGDLTFVFTNDTNLLEKNVEFLQHDTLTDIITFDYSEGTQVNGDILISIDRVKENAAKFGVDFADELHRVMIHGVLHLCGFKDKKAGDKAKMRMMEDEALRLRSAHF